MNSKPAYTSPLRPTGSGGFNPIKNLRPESVIRALDAFNDGRLSSACRIFEAIAERDDTIC